MIRNRDETTKDFLNREYIETEKAFKELLISYSCLKKRIENLSDTTSEEIDEMDTIYNRAMAVM